MPPFAATSWMRLMERPSYRYQRHPRRRQDHIPAAICQREIRYRPLLPLYQHEQLLLLRSQPGGLRLRIPARGGKVLLIDQVFKHPDWSKELRLCYDRFPNLKIVFTGSSVMRLKEENLELRDIAKSYNLRGFSFREYLNLQTDMKFHAYSLEEILSNHEQIAKGILSKVRPLDYFQDYMHHGFYPFFLEKRNFSENLLKTMNMMVEVDILLIKQIELKYLSKIKKLLYLLAVDGPKAPNVSQLANDIQTSRATVMNYIKYLADARLINMVYPKGEEFPKKPSKIMMHNSNLMYSIYPVRWKSRMCWKRSL